MREAVPALRRGLESDDVFLAGKCMVALARLGDEASLATVERMYQATGNPRLLIHGAAALELFGRPASLATLLGPLERNPTPFARDEIILAAAGILRIADTFYPLYQEFLAEPRHGLALLSDFLEERQEAAAARRGRAGGARRSHGPGAAGRRSRRVPGGGGTRPGGDAGGGRGDRPERRAAGGAGAAAHRRAGAVPVPRRHRGGVLHVAGPPAQPAPAAAAGLNGGHPPTAARPAPPAGVGLTAVARCRYLLSAALLLKKKRRKCA